MKNAVLFLVLAVTVATATGLRVAGSDARLGGTILDSRFQILDCRLTDGGFEDTVAIAYDDGTHKAWWCSDRDSFGAAVKFTPASYPCQIVGARAEVGCDTTMGGRQVYLRVFDDNGTGGLPGTVLREEHRTDVPKGQNVGFRDYDLTAPVVIDSGDFYLCFWQKHFFNMVFGTDQHLDWAPREWWFFPDLKWVTPMGMDAADMLIRARVLYASGVEEELTPHLAPRLTLSPNPATGGSVRLSFTGPLDHSTTRPLRISISDVSGRCVQSTICNLKSAMPLDLRSMPAGVYLVRVEAADFTATQKLVVQR